MVTEGSPRSMRCKVTLDTPAASAATASTEFLPLPASANSGAQRLQPGFQNVADGR